MRPCVRTTSDLCRHLENFASAMLRNGSAHSPMARLLNSPVTVILRITPVTEKNRKKKKRGGEKGKCFLEKTNDSAKRL